MGILMLMSRKFPFEEGEWYHCYSRGVDKRKVFEEEGDLIRFLELLYLANDSAPLHRADIGTHAAKDIFSRERLETLVTIGAYALMPNHYHVLIKEMHEGGLSTFMRKLGTAYTMYFNQKYERVGNLFLKPFRARHVDGDGYFQHVVQYIHLNPAELFEPEWKMGKVKDMRALQFELKQYPYSSLQDHQEDIRPARGILDREVFSIVEPLSLSQIVIDAAVRYEAQANINP